MVLRPGQRVVNVPGIGVSVSRRAVSSGAGNWWEAGGATGAVAVYQPIGAASLAASYVNLANPGTCDAADGTAPSFDAATGWRFATNKYLRTGIIPAYTWTILVRFSDASLNVLFGTNFVRWAIWPAYPGDKIDYIWNNNDNFQAPALTAGTIGYAGNLAYRNGVLDKTLSGTPTLTTEIYIGATNNGGTATFFGTNNIQAVAIYNTTLTAPMVLAVSTAMAAL